MRKSLRKRFNHREINIKDKEIIKNVLVAECLRSRAMEPPCLLFTLVMYLSTHWKIRVCFCSIFTSNLVY